ncbi:uncharacterized protein N0V89_008215 [Didymosphaeria variabile]|uniref:Heterokaryon incompatibility domain-containing protein n=1 Tax=Didymosphaeria variabile TaxID=1932322 RepID=A0A9W8XFC2_9PLEO|nr:uncharacterized protein N0V89_008215 [Didymosphaeria variabile]KAJ4349599.1 hypothetical protein N0V89_008215 [Didymosphaeria variabile]
MEDKSGDEYLYSHDVCRQASEQVDALCPTCEIIAFDSSIERTLQLGKHAELKQNQNCPLCRFALHELKKFALAETTYSLVLQPNGVGKVRCEEPEGSSYFTFTKAINHNPEVPDFIVARNWLQECNDSHDGACHQPDDERATPPTDMRLIDVQEAHLIQAPSRARYVALSYIWGTKGNVKATRANKAFFEQPGSLLSTEAGIPPLIRDVMQLVAAMEQRYLWVDALCIIQDDEGDRQKQISCMDAIYENAHFTIITLMAQGVFDRVPGIGSRRIRYYEIVKEMRLWHSGKPQLTELVDQSMWSTRGWTFQEHVLSRRRMFLTKSEVFFDCAKGSVSELEPERTRPQDLAFWALPGPDPQFTFHKSFHDACIGSTQPSHLAMAIGAILESEKIDLEAWRYYKQAENYSGRLLTFSGDVLNAFTGVMSSWHRIRGWQFCNGLPMPALRRALCWTAFKVLNAREATEKKSTLIPTWSWAHWSGSVRFAPTDDPGHPNSYMDYKEDREQSNIQILPASHTNEHIPDILRVQSPVVTLTVSSKDALRYRGSNVESTALPMLRMLIFDQHKRHCGMVWGVHPSWFEPPGDKEFEFIYLFDLGENSKEDLSLVQIKSWEEAMAMASDTSQWREPLLSGVGKAVYYDKTEFPDTEHDGPRRTSPTGRSIFALIVKRQGPFYERLGVGQIVKQAWDEALPTIKVCSMI